VGIRCTNEKRIVVGRSNSTTTHVTVNCVRSTTTKSNASRYSRCNPNNDTGANTSNERGVSVRVITTVNSRVTRKTLADLGNVGRASGGRNDRTGGTSRGRCSDGLVNANSVAGTIVGTRRDNDDRRDQAAAENVCSGASGTTDSG